MKVSLQWLKEFLPELNWDTGVLSDKLTLIGHETEVASDQVIDVTLTPNRVDCQSVFGLCRDLAAVYGLKLHYPTMTELPKPSKVIDVTINRSASNDLFADTLVFLENYQPVSSPNWLKQKLAILELEPKDLLIDLSNVVAHEYGVPLHVFDKEKVSSGLTIRHAKAGEKIELLNGKTITTGKANLVQESDDELVDLAGIMGGGKSAVTKSTHAVVIQAAIFAPTTVRQSSRSVYLPTAASTLYGRGIDPTALLPTLQRFVNLALEFAPGLTIKGLQVVKEQATQLKPINISADFPSRYLGRTITEKDMGLLAKTGLVVTPNSITAPPFRSDINSPETVYGELIRLLGYSALKTQPLPKIAHQSSPQYRYILKVKSQLALTGLTETLSMALTKIHGDQEITNTSPNNARFLRTSLKEGLLEAVGRNQFIRNPAFFEVGSVFLAKKEEEHLGVIVSKVTPELQHTLAQLLGAPAVWQEITQNEKDQYKLRIKKLFYIEKPLVMPQHLSDRTVVAALGLPGQVRPISKFPPVYRDLTLILDAGKETEKKIVDSFLALKEVLLCEVIDRYFDDEKVGTGKVATTFRVLFQDVKRSLTDQEVQDFLEKHFQRLKKQVPFEQR